MALHTAKKERLQMVDYCELCGTKIGFMKKILVINIFCLILSFYSSDVFASDNYIIQSQKNEMALMMKKGYEEMSQINLEISEYCLGADDNALRFYEEKLAECE